MSKKMIIVVPDDLHKRFREAVFKRYGMRKGDISRAVCEAIELWLKENGIDEGEDWTSALSA